MAKHLKTFVYTGSTLAIAGALAAACSSSSEDDKAANGTGGQAGNANSGGTSGEGGDGSGTGGKVSGTGGAGTGGDGLGGKGGEGGADPLCAPAPDGLAYWWDEEPDANDTTRVRELIVGKDGEVKGETFAFAAGPVGKALDITDGVSFEVPHEGKWPVGSFEFWFSTESADPGGLMLLGQYGKDGTSFGVVMFNGYLNVSFNPPPVEDGLASASMQSQFKVNDGKLHHVGASFDPEAGTFIMYLDGAKSGEMNFSELEVDTSVAVGVFEAENQTLIVGGDWYSDSSYVGFVDEVSFYSTTLSADDMKSIYDAGKHGKCAP